MHFLLDITASSESYDEQILHMVFALIGVICMVSFLAFAFKRFMTRRVRVANKAGLIKILDRRALSPKACLYLIEVNGKHLVIGESHGGLTSLGEVPPAPFQEEPTPAPSFINVLKQKFTGTPK